MLYVGYYICTQCKRECDLYVGKIGQPSFQPKSVKEFLKHCAKNGYPAVEKDGKYYQICANCRLENIRKSIK